MARRYIGSTRRGTVQGSEYTPQWVKKNISKGSLLMQIPERYSPAVDPIYPRSRLLESFKNSGLLRHQYQFVLQLPGAYVTGTSVGVITPDRTLLTDLSLEFGEPEVSHGSMRRLFFPKPKKLLGRWVLLATTGGNSYYHHLLEVLPRMEMLTQASIPPESIDGYIVNSSTHSYQVESWKLLGLDSSKIKFTDKKAYYHCDELIAPSLPDTPGSLWPPSAKFLKNLLGVSTPPPTKHFLYVARAGHLSRGLVNERGVWSLLQKRGFTRVFCEDLTLREQAQLFSQAKVVIGPHGGGFANMVFAQENSLLVEFFNPRYVNPCFWRIACAVGARHAYFLGEPDYKKSRLADATGRIFLSEATLRELDDFLTQELA